MLSAPLNKGVKVDSVDYESHVAIDWL